VQSSGGIAPVTILYYFQTFVLNNLKFFFVRRGTIKPRLNTITQNWTYARFVKQ
jgi:hypothetical protein